LTRDYAKKVVLVGSEADTEACANIIALSAAPAANLAGKTCLSSLACLIQKSCLFIGIDSGPSHISSCENKPTVILYSGTNKVREWAPRGKLTIAIQKDLTCSGCQKLLCDHNSCMELISVEDVLLAAKGLLGPELKAKK
jgi:ADP-heptose:LPS heptosyltransferase